MKTVQKTIALGFLAAAILGGLTSKAYGEMVQGEVMEIDPQGTYLRIARNDPENNASEPESVKVLINADTTLEEFQGLAELRPGDEVWADITQDGKKTWSASKIRLDKVDIKAPGDAAAEKAASQSEVAL